MRRFGTARAFARRMARRADRVLRGGGWGLVLVYHRVADEPSDPYGLCVTPAQFREHLEALRSAGSPVPVSAMARAVRDGGLPDGAIGITFDDAYLDVLVHAVPLLRGLDVPATIFVTTGSAGRDREFWWDALERVFLEPDRLPAELELEVGGQRLRWSLGTGGTLDEPRRTTASGWHLDSGPAPTARHTVFREVYHRLRPLPEPDRGRALDTLAAWAGVPSDGVRDTRRVMSPEQVAGLAEEGRFEIGAHTVTHPDLRSLDPAARRTEARQSREDLERWTGQPIEGFAFPYGLHDPASVEAVRAAGFAFACTGDHMAVRPGAEPLRLPRVDVPAGDGDALARLIRNYLG